MRNIKHISERAKEYFPFGNMEGFITDYFDEMVNLCMEGKTIPLPLNLGYLQCLEHLAEFKNKDVEHARIFGNLDYSLIWIRHPMFHFHRIKVDKRINDKVKQNKLKGVKYKDTFESGDYYVSTKSIT